MTAAALGLERLGNPASQVDMQTMKNALVRAFLDGARGRDNEQ